ncbi:MAG: hypothetical protein WCH44_16480 [Betaproteobacteria bacterium]
MAFVNEFITPEDFKKYDIEGVFKKIEGPVFIYAPPYGWTIDRARNIFLLYITVGHEERSNRLTFALWWDGAVIVTEVEMLDGSHSDRYSGHAIWGLAKLNVPKNFLIEREEVVRTLKDAMTCYGYIGPFRQLKSYTVEFNF